MKRFKKILVYAGSAKPDDPALQRATTLARNNGATVEIVDVVEELPAYVRLLAPASWDLADVIATERLHALQILAGPLQEEGLEVSTQVLMGHPAETITRHVLSSGHDLVLKTAQPESGPHRQWYGTLAKRLMRICPCPVWIIDPQHAERFSQIVAAIDPHPESDEKTELNRGILEMASSLAEQEHADLHLVHVWSAFGLTLMQHRMPEDQLSQYVSDCEAAARETVDQFLAELPELGVNLQVHLLRGDAQDAIIRFVAEENVDLVVMGTVCRTGISGYVIGNTAEKILGQIGSSVLAVKPAGFRSPMHVSSDETATGVEVP